MLRIMKGWKYILSIHLTSVLKNKSVRNFEEATENILHFMSKLININTLFVAKNDKQINEIKKAVNKNAVLLEAGSTLPFHETFCKVSVDKGNEILLIEDIMENEQTKHLNVTADLGGGSFIAIPIYYEDGENYGTICGLDTESFEFTEQHIELFQTMSSLLTYVLELDKANKEIKDLSVPIVPLTKGVAILPIIGHINEYRADIIIQSTLESSTNLELEYMIIDLSGVSRINNKVSEYLLNIVKLLKLIGVTPILTGFRPDLAMKTLEIDVDFNGIMITNNLESALFEIGFILNKTENKHLRSQPVV
ncbi:GAF domain-containing protein [Fictibacillus sp. b24]|uniref:GAF domain-containing protein n=1 Tax=Fictibacillus sp. b24 TaxID=3055863 RepID=UPI0025A2D643|nr:GAF domain-containing protein [Fictibacillus sp. b24]MDM5315251.1 GAF domain-containing protein [Fictibacillus sp. b24]